MPREKARAAEVAALRSEMSHLSDETDGAWIVQERIRRERGVLTFDMHGLDAPMAAGATEKLLGIRESLQRVRIVTGRGKFCMKNLQILVYVRQYCKDCESVRNRLIGRFWKKLVQSL